MKRASGEEEREADGDRDLEPDLSVDFDNDRRDERECDERGCERVGDAAARLLASWLARFDALSLAVSDAVGSPVTDAVASVADSGSRETATRTVDEEESNTDRHSDARPVATGAEAGTTGSLGTEKGARDVSGIEEVGVAGIDIGWSSEMTGRSGEEEEGVLVNVSVRDTKDSGGVDDASSFDSGALR